MLLTKQTAQTISATARTTHKMQSAPRKTGALTSRPWLIIVVLDEAFVTTLLDSFDEYVFVCAHVFASSCVPLAAPEGPGAAFGFAAETGPPLGSVREGLPDSHSEHQSPGFVGGNVAACQI